MKPNKRMMQFALVSLLSFNLSCISLSYLNDLALHQATIIRSQEKISDVLEQNNLDKKTQAYLQETQLVMGFCESIGLKTEGNYQSFVQLQQDSVTYVVGAAYKDRLEKYIWDYPIVGKLPYKGYPKKEKALAEAKKMQSEGYDTYVRGVSAYSTLGWFNDPVFSSMLRLDRSDYVSTLIHETLHVNIFFKGRADYNEQIASIVGLEGALLYFKERGESKYVKILEDKWDDAIFFANFISQEIEDLKAWYQSQERVTEEKRQQYFANIKTRFSKNVLPRLKSDSYKGFSKIELNNARLLTFGTYMKDIVPIYQDYKARGISLKDWIEELRTLPEDS